MLVKDCANDEVGEGGTYIKRLASWFEIRRQTHKQYLGTYGWMESPISNQSE